MSFPVRSYGKCVNTPHFWFNYKHIRCTGILNCFINVPWQQNRNRTIPISTVYVIDRHETAFFSQHRFLYQEKCPHQGTSTQIQCKQEKIHTLFIYSYYKAEEGRYADVNLSNKRKTVFFCSTKCWLRSTVLIDYCNRWLHQTKGFNVQLISDTIRFCITTKGPGALLSSIHSLACKLALPLHHIRPIHPSPLINQESRHNVLFFSLGVTWFQRMHRLPFRRPRCRD